ncbi:hypothetical protein L195_g046699 [Trifolium pratense]|uniref:Uncharacterized protein n=1 Tax=Trifolium pratense TaxID=57577 RepID=A0A2K3MII5_TRIPR|nr:hypothetical protein L195_g046699 [Trifolium pratense]
MVGSSSDVALKLTSDGSVATSVVGKEPDLRYVALERVVASEVDKIDSFFKRRIMPSSIIRNTSP